MIRFTVELAGVAVEIRCRFEGNREFLRDYVTQEAPVVTIEPTDADLARMQAEFDRADEASGLARYRRPDEFLENNAIHSLVAERLVDHDVLLMHGSALCMDGDAYIFTARSGTGKSTHARLWREAFGGRVWMINDDKPLLRIGQGGVTVHGTPWDGKHRLSRNASAPLRAVADLNRDARNHVAPMSRPDAFPVLVRQCFVSRDPRTVARVMELERRLLDAVEFFTMGCNMEPEAATVVWEAMGARHGRSDRSISGEHAF